jgi:hypothetical protein
MTFSLVSNMVFSIPSASTVISAGTTGAAVCPAAINIAAMAGTLRLEHRYDTQAAAGGWHALRYSEGRADAS